MEFSLLDGLEIEGERGDLFLKDVDIEAQVIGRVLSGERSCVLDLANFLKEFNKLSMSQKEFISSFREKEALWVKQKSSSRISERLSLEEFWNEDLYVFSLLILSYKSDVDIRNLVLEKEAPGWLVESLIYDKIPSVRYNSAIHKNIPSYQRDAWLKKATPFEKSDFVLNTPDMKYLREHLKSDTREKFHALVSKNTNLDSATAKILLEYCNEKIATYLLQQKWDLVKGEILDTILEKFAGKCSDMIIERRAAEHPHLSSHGVPWNYLLL